MNKKTIIKVIILAAIFFWIITIFVDFFRVSKNREPIFCLNKITNTYDDGNTHICIGLGYKGIRYNRKCRVASEFGPIIIKERTCE